MDKAGWTQLCTAFVGFSLVDRIRRNAMVSCVLELQKLDWNSMVGWNTVGLCWKECMVLVQVPEGCRESAKGSFLPAAYSRAREP